MKPESPHVSNPFKYAKKTMEILEGNINNCAFTYQMMAYVGLANRYIEDAYYEEQIDMKTMVDMYNKISDIIKKTENYCICTEKHKD